MCIYRRGMMRFISCFDGLIKDITLDSIEEAYGSLSSRSSPK